MKTKRKNKKGNEREKGNERKGEKETKGKLKIKTVIGLIKKKVDKLFQSVIKID